MNREYCIVTSIKTHVSNFTCSTMFIYFTFLAEMVFLKLGFWALLCLSQIMLPYHEIIIREDGRAKRGEVEALSNNNTNNNNLMRKSQVLGK